MPLDTAYDYDAVRIGAAHWFLSADADLAVSGGWRYMGLTSKETTLTKGEGRATVELEGLAGSGLGDYAFGPTLTAGTSLTVISKRNLADTRPGSTAFLDGATLVAVGIGAERRTDLTASLPTILIIPEWCDLAGMAASAAHDDWQFALFVWRAAWTEQGAISAASASLAMAPVKISAVLARTPAGMAQQIPSAYALWYRGNPKAAPVGHAIRTVADAMVLPNFATLLSGYDPTDVLIEEMDAWVGDPFTEDGMEFLGRLAGARSLDFSTSVELVMHEQFGDTPIAAVLAGAQASVELSAVELNLALYERMLARAAAVVNAGETVGLGHGDPTWRQITTRNSLLLRPVSATDASRDLLIPHAVPVGPFEEPVKRERRELKIKFVGRYWNGDEFPAGARLAIFGDAAAAGVEVLY